MRNYLLLLVLALACAATAQNTSGQNQSAPAPTSADDVTPQHRLPKPAAQPALDRAQDLLFRQKNPAASIDEFKKAIKADPWYAQSYLLLGLAYMQLEKWNEAQFAFEQATKVEPGNAQAYLGWGSALNEEKDYAGAQKALQRSLELNPDSAEAHYELARSLGALGKWQAAAPHAQRAIELNPDYPGPHAIMGNVYLDQQDPEAARTEFKEYLRLDPDGSLAPAVKQIIAEIDKSPAPESAKKKRP